MAEDIKYQINGPPAPHHPDNIRRGAGRRSGKGAWYVDEERR